jgi:uncharacterized cupredoxin-like copper-binding protein
MNLFSRTALVTVAALATLSFTQVMAAAPAAKIQVALDGEADQPMKINVDKPSVKAGLVEFDVKNVALGTDHEVVLIKLQKKGQKITSDAKTHRIDEKKFKSMGEVGGLKPGAAGVLKVKLTAGDYVLLCNHKAHYELGMSIPFTVTN